MGVIYALMLNIRFADDSGVGLACGGRCMVRGSVSAAPPLVSKGKMDSKVK